MSKRLTCKQWLLVQNKENIIKCYQGGASLREVAYLFDAHTSHVRSMLKEEGVQLRPSGRKPGSKRQTDKRPKKDKRVWVDRQGQSYGTLYNKKLQEDKSRIRDWLIEKYKNTPCMDCGNVFDWCAMDFDHRPGETKELKIGSIGFRKASTQLKERVELEITKCDLVCACCHRVRTKQRKGERNEKAGS